MNRHTMYSIGECEICGTGPLGIRVCGRCGEVVILCDECDAIWIDGQISGKPVFFEDPDLPCPGCSDSLWEPPAHWASLEEIEATEWLAAAVRNGQIVLEKETPLGTSESGDEIPDG